MYKYYFTAIFLLCRLLVSGQDTTIVPDKVLHVPTLGKAIDMALEHSPLLKVKDVEKAIKIYQLKSTRKEWLDYIGMEGYWKYGTIDNVTIQEIDNSMVPTTYTGINTRFATGVYIKMSFFSFLDHRNKVLQAQEAIDKSNYEREIAQDEIRKLVIQQYNEYLLAKKILLVKTKSKVAIEIQLQKAEQDYENGNINIYELTKVMESSNKLMGEYQKAVTGFRVAYLMLMDLIGELDKVNLNN
jgi:outer membrane protein TolC